eukprot:GHUV01021123.1.p3 GENE.GHUV01021123.1~~GHUV01021123.1.p3  ORF type:complete len:101 (-),score=11.55 GHUV01021123.1:520-822(-)
MQVAERENPTWLCRKPLFEHHQCDCKHHGMLQHGLVVGIAMADNARKVLSGENMHIWLFLACMVLPGCITQFRFIGWFVCCPSLCRPHQLCLLCLQQCSQ